MQRLRRAGPVQSGSSRVLKRMLRRYTRDGYIDCVSRLREQVPGIALTTDIIVGFPGETDSDFLETCSLVEEVGYDDAYTFKYSPREGTPARSGPWCSVRTGRAWHRRALTGR